MVGYAYINYVSQTPKHPKLTYRFLERMLFKKMFQISSKQGYQRKC